jgi:hypothetical protein
VPQRLIDRQLRRPLGRFDSLDPSDRRPTPRAAACPASGTATAQPAQTRVSAYAIRYRWTLNSNFTYALERPGHAGDQFKQQDRRSVFGLQASQAWSHSLGGLDAQRGGAVQLRHDRIRVGLFDTVAPCQHRHHARRPRARDRSGQRLRAEQRDAAAVAARHRAGVRADRVSNRVDSLSLADNSGRASDTQVSPKLSLVAGPFAKTEFFFNPAAACTATTPAAPPRVSTHAAGDAVDRRAAAGGQPGWETGRAHRGTAGPAELAGAVEAGLRLRAGLHRRRRCHRGQRRQPAPRRGVQQPLDAGPACAVRCRPGLDARSFRQRRPHSERGGLGGQPGHDVLQDLAPQAVTPLAVSAYSSIWSKFMYL